MKKLSLYITIIISFFFFLNSLHAYEVDYDYVEREVFVTTLLTIDELPEGSNGLYSVEYDLGSVSGQLEGDVLWEDHVTMVSGRYRRIAGVNDLVRVPAGSSVAVSALIRNDSGDDVEIEGWNFFLSRAESSLGDIGNFLVKDVDFLSANYLFDGEEFSRQGYAKPFSSSVEVVGGDTSFVHLGSLDIFQPFEISSFDWTPNILENGDLVVDFVLVSKNIASFELKDIEFTHGDFYEKRDFSSNEEYVYEYSVNFGKNYSGGLNLLDSFEIHSGSSRLECAVSGSLDLDGFGDSRSLNYKSSGIDLDWYPNNLGMCVDLVEYTLVGDKLEYYAPVDVNFSFVGDGEVLGFGDGLDLRVKVENRGMGLESASVKLDFDEDFQILKSSSCDFELGEGFVLLEVFDLNLVSEVFCDVSFEVENTFVILENFLLLDGEVLDSVEYSLVPNFEFSFEYDYDLEDFVFESNELDFSDVVFVEDELDDLVCGRVFFDGLRDDVCI